MFVPTLLKDRVFTPAAWSRVVGFLDQACRFHDANDAEGENLAGKQEDGEINPHLVPPRTGC
jgi:hypothetical protein